MKSLMQNMVSFLKKRFEPCHLSTTDIPGNTIVSGYSRSSDINPQARLPENCDRRRVAILYADVANYSGLTEQDEEGTHLRLVEGMKTMKAHVFANNGRVAHIAGDAILAEFRDAASALQCAVDVQIAGRELNAQLNADQWVLFRIGVNFGDVIADHGDIYGNAVNLAARLEQLAHVGGICVSRSIRAELGNSSSFSFVAMGKRYVKNISEPVDAFWIKIDSRRFADSDISHSSPQLLYVSAIGSDGSLQAAATNSSINLSSRDN